jgi:hypothetical protein
MTFRGVALWRLAGFARRVTDHITAPRTAEHCCRRSPAGILAVREAQLTAALCAAPPRPGFARGLGVHSIKRTASSAWAEPTPPAG